MASIECLTLLLGDKTPCELLYGKSPPYSPFHTFGCFGTYMITKYQRINFVKGANYVSSWDIHMERNDSVFMIIRMKIL